MTSLTNTMSCIARCFFLSEQGGAWIWMGMISYQGIARDPLQKKIHDSPSIVCINPGTRPTWTIR